MKTYDDRTLRIRTASHFIQKVNSMAGAVQQFNIYRVISGGLVIQWENVRYRIKNGQSTIGHQGSSH